MTKITYIPGEIANAAIDEHGNRKPVTRTQHIFDDTKGKSQAEVNADIDNNLNQLSDEIDAVNKQDIIPVDTLPAVATADPRKIYRVVGEASYTDYMVNASGDGWKTLATYSFPGIDDEPTAGSDNLVKSGGVFDYISLDNNLSSAYEYNARITDGGSWQVAPNNKCYIIPTKILDRILVNRKSGVNANYAYIESLSVVNGQPADFYDSTGLVGIDGPNKDVEIVVNKSAKYFYVVLTSVGTDMLNTCLFNRFAFEHKTDAKFGSLISSGYLYGGIATASTNPGIPTVKVFYIATQAGTYTNFGNLTIVQGITILKYDGFVWSQELVWGVDDEPSYNSSKMVKSGGVFDYVSIENNLLSAYEKGYRITDSGYWQAAANNKCYLIPTKILDRIMVNRKSGVNAKYAYVESLPVDGQAASFYGSTGLVDIDGPNKDVEITVNKLAKYFYVVLLNGGTEILNYCLFNRFAYEEKTDSIIAENVSKLNTLYASTSNYMTGQFAGLFSHFKVSNPNRQYYLRKFTASQLTIGYIDGNNCYSLLDIPFTVGNLVKVYNGYEYIECVVANTDGLTPESASVTDITNARKRVIYGKTFKSVVHLNNSSFVDLLIDNLYIDKPIQNGVLFVRHLRMSSANNYINIGIYKDNSLYGHVDVYLTKKSQTVSIGVWNISIELSDIAISGYFGVMSDIMNIDKSYTYFKADVITNKANFNALYEAAQKSAIEPLFTYDDNLTGTEMMQRMLNSRLFEKQMVDNVICEFEGGSDSTSCYHGDYFYTATVEGTTNDVFWGTGCKTVLYINNKSDGSLVSRTIIAEENKQVTIGGSTITMQRGASMPNLVITNDGLCVLFCTMVNNVFVLMRCLVDLSDNTIISYSICTINGEQLNTTQIKNLGGVYSDMTREFSININGNFRDAKDDNGYWYVGVTGAYALKYPMIMKTNNFEAFTFVTFITADSMNAAYECSTGFYKQPGGVANTPYLYTATRQSELSKGGNSFIMVNVINLSTNKVEQTRMISGADSRPCIFAHRNGHLILAYSLPGYRMRTRLVWLTRPDVQSLIQDGTFMNCGYFNFFKDDNAPQYYCVVALAASNLTNSQYLTSCQIGEYSLDSARNIIDNLVL